MDWSYITSSRFEELACLYTRDVYKEFTWIPTKKTRDGNRDGEFEEEIDTLKMYYKGWYEAKYTAEPLKSIPKSHMDSTLVSGILDGCVCYIVFITNGKITKEFRRRAKAILAPHKIEVDFVDGEMLEEWLFRTPSVYNAFFEDHINDSFPIVPVIEIDDICFFDGYMTPSALIAPISKLQQGNEYFFYISIRSNIHINVDIKWNLSSLFVLSVKEANNDYPLTPGFNSYMIKVLAKEALSDSLIVELISDNKKVAKYILPHFTIEEDNEPQLSYSSQTAIIQEIYNYTMIAKSDNLVFSIIGKSGCGKSYLLRKIAKNLLNRNINLLSLELSDKAGENAVAVCRLILFLNFGNLYTLSKEAFNELIRDSINLPIEIYHKLKEGTNNQIVAINIVKQLNELLSNPLYSLIMQKNILDKSVAYLIIDDLHKATSNIYPILRNILEEFSKHKSGQMALLGYRQSEFTIPEFEYLIDDINNKMWYTKDISSFDVRMSIEKNISTQIAEISELFAIPISVMQLYLLVRKLDQKEINSLPIEKQLSCYKKAYIETNIQNGEFAKNKIKACPYGEMLYIIYKIESGVPIQLLKSFYKNEFCSQYEYLSEEKLVKQENDIVKPFHDIYLYAFLDINFDEKYIYILESFLKICMPYNNEFPVLVSNIVSILISDSSKARLTYGDTIRVICKKYYEQSQYIAAKNLAIALLPEFGTITATDYSNQDIEILFIYAQSIKYAESHLDSNKYLQQICKIGELQNLKLKEKSIIYEAHSELLNNAIWELEKKEAQKQIDYLKTHLDVTIESGISNYLENAYLNLLNRTLLFNAEFEDMSLYEDLFQTALLESKRLEREDYVGYALMDFAKSNVIYNANDSIDKLETALEIFKKFEHCKKRYYDCKAEIVFFKAIIHGNQFNELYDIQHNAYLEKFGHVYIKTSLKLLALELVAGSEPQNVDIKLNKLMLQYPDICSQYRLHLFYYMLKAAIQYIEGNYKSQCMWCNKQENMSEQLSDNYRLVPLHNKTIHTSNSIEWFMIDGCNENVFWLDPRIW
mgnify:CR=1 FL=1